MSWADERDLRPGHVVGPFELLALIGRGGMARVWAARERETGNYYALKMLRSHLAEDQTFREMFFDEARIASLAQHENIAHTYELIEIDGILCLVMELVDGPSLVRIIRPGSAERDDARRVPIAPRLSARIVAEACAGLHAAHELRDENGRPLAVVHRDVSPQNVLVACDGRVKVTDFGVAKALNKINVTLAGQIKGKLAYMSPEQLAGGGIDRRSDVFALGTLLYELTVGQRAFDGDSDPEVMRAILTGEPIPPSRIKPGYPIALEQIIMRAIAPQPEQRWQTAAHMQDALEKYIAQSGPPVGPPDLANLINERVAPSSGTAPAPAPQPVQNVSTSVMAPIQPPQQPQGMQGTPHIVSGTRRREEPAKTSLVTLISAMVVGLILGMLVLRSVYNARKTRLSPNGSPSALPSTAPTMRSTAGLPTMPTVAPTTTIAAPPTGVPANTATVVPVTPVVAPTVAPAVSATDLDLPAPRPATKPAKSAAPALPPNPYE
jgi:serine/threonine-protein kinase